MAAGDVTEVAFVLEDAVVEIATECKLPRGKVQARGGASGRGKYDPLHRPIPQRADRRAWTRRPCGRSRIGLELSRVGRTQEHDPQGHRRTGQVDEARAGQILACRDKKELEDLYLPYKPKRRTRATSRGKRGLDLRGRSSNGRSTRAGWRQEVFGPTSVPTGRARRRGGAARRVRHRGRAWADDLRSAAKSATRCARYALSGGSDGPASPASSRCTTTTASRGPRSPRTVTWQSGGEAEEVLRIGIEIDDEAVIRHLTGRLVTNPSFLFRRELTETVADCCRRLLFLPSRPHCWPK